MSRSFATRPVPSPSTFSVIFAVDHPFCFLVCLAFSFPVHQQFLARAKKWPPRGYGNKKSLLVFGMIRRGNTTGDCG